MQEHVEWDQEEEDDHLRPMLAERGESLYYPPPGDPPPGRSTERERRACFLCGASVVDQYLKQLLPGVVPCQGARSRCAHSRCVQRAQAGGVKQPCMCEICKSSRGIHEVHPPSLGLGGALPMAAMGLGEGPQVTTDQLKNIVNKAHRKRLAVPPPTLDEVTLVEGWS